MFPRRMLFIGIAALVVFAIFGTVISNVQRDAWTQGYLVGQLSAQGDGKAAALAPLAYGGGYPGMYGGPHFGGIGLVFLLGFGFLAFMGFSRFMMWRYWMSQRGPEGQGQPGNPGAAQGGPWGGPWGHRHGHRPPPWWGWDSVPGRGTETPAPESTNGPATGEGGQA
jgi:hypothetical protein